MKFYWGPQKGGLEQKVTHSNKGGEFMKMKRFLAISLVLGVVLGTSSLGMTADVSLKESYRLSHFVPWPTSLIWISEYGFQCRFEIEKLWQVTT